MPSSINASTTAGVVTTADTSGVLNIQTAGTTALTVDTTTNVGIGTTSPAQTLHVKTSTSATPITLGVLSNATGLPALSFNGAYASTTMAGIYGNGATASSLYYEVPSGQSHFFGIADATKITINSSGNLKAIGTISVGDATPSTSGAGITFPATQSASTNANTLDDYEEGTWTPTFSSFNGTYTVQQGAYTKIGKVVTVQVYISAATLGTSAGNFIAVASFPFAALAGNTYGVSGSVHGTSWVTPRTSPNMLMSGSSTVATVYINMFSGASGFQPTYADIGISGNLLFSMTYISDN
jgi:hypothetical protein